jgi:hypothetical protein
VKKHRQYNGQKKKGKRRNINLQYFTQKTKDRATRTPLKTEDDLGCSGRVSSSCSTCGTRRVIIAANPVISPERGKDRIVITTNGPYPLRELCGSKRSNWRLQWSVVNKIQVTLTLALFSN